MRPPISLTALVSLVATTAYAADADAPCQPGDGAALQACFDADTDGVIRLAPGTYTNNISQPPATIVNRGVHIRALDPGKPPKIVCELGTDGRPALPDFIPGTTPPARPLNNIGLVITASNAVVSGVELEDLVFHDCRAGVLLNRVGTGGFEGADVHDLKVVNSYTGLNLTALLSASVHDNRVVDSDTGINAIGAPPPPDNPNLGVVLTNHVTVTDNSVAGNDDADWIYKTFHIGIVVANANGVVSGNEVRRYKRLFQTTGRGITTGGRDTAGDFHLDIVDNLIHGAGVGIATGGPANQTTGAHLTRATGTIEGNQIRDINWYAITAFHGSSGWTFGLNELHKGSQEPFAPPNEGLNGDILLTGAVQHPGVPPAPIVPGTGKPAGSSNITVYVTPRQTVVNMQTPNTSTVTVVEDCD